MYSCYEATPTRSAWSAGKTHVPEAECRKKKKGVPGGPGHVLECPPSIVQGYLMEYLRALPGED